MNISTAQSTSSLYIHWPFCPYKCHFCPFVAIAGHDSFMSAYHSSLKKEIISYAQQLDKPTISTIFLGGGTPSTYPAPLLLDMFDTLRTMFTFSPDIEITIEVNPGTVTAELMQVWKEVGINRLSIGVQSLKDSALTSLNRHQTAEQVAQVITLGKPLFDSLSIDLILGLPEVSRAEWEHTVTQAMTWPISHISVYFLTIHENTPLYFKVKKNQVQIPVDDDIVPMYHWTRTILQQHGFEQYELSNFAKPGYESRHNMVYWQRKPYKGFGLGACSFDGTVRYQNEKNLMNYINDLQEGRSVKCDTEHVTEEHKELEILMLGLRSRQGVRVSEFTATYSAQEKEAFSTKVAEFSARALVQQNDDLLRLTPTGLLLENEIVVQLARIKNG